MKNFIKKIVVYILRAEAELILLKYKPRIVGVTGNAGKTSTKDAIYEVISLAHSVRRSQGTMNTEFGTPLTIIGCESGWNSFWRWLYNILYGLVIIIFPHHYPEWLVLELGADRPGDIKYLSSWLPLNVAIITALGEVPSHVEFFKDKEHLATEKRHILDALVPSGVAILDGDDKSVRNMRGKSEHNIITYGLSADNYVRGSNDRIIYERSKSDEIPLGISFKVDINGTSIPARMHGVFGKHHIPAALAAVSVAHVLHINLVKALESLQDYSKAPGRLRLIEGEKECIILDDSYNASPLATDKALDSLKTIKARGRKIAILGDNMELGGYTILEHEKIGKKAAKVCDVLVTVGQRAKYIADGARENGMEPDDITSFDTAVEARDYIEPLIKSGDMILVKGSQAVRMERIVLGIMAHPERALNLLVRQDPEWLSRD